MNNFGDLIQEYYVEKFRSNMELRKQKLANLKTPGDVNNYIASIQAKLASAYHFPAEKSPLNVQTMGTIRKDGYRIEKIIYHSRPNYPVTANLYVPDNAQPGKTPAIIHLLGHALDGKACVSYQALSITLCKQGALVLVADPVGQGERLSLPDYPQFQNTREHNLLNRRLTLLGDNVSAWRAYDAIRGVDLLLSRKETDPNRIGVTGNSGGGTMTTIVNALEPRLLAAAPNCYITTWLHNAENELPVDGEQIPLGLAADGGEMADLLIAKAPNPLLIMGEKNDFFDPRGTREVYEEIKRIYTILGKPENVSLFIGEQSHGFNPPARLAAYDFFQNCFQLQNCPNEPQFTPATAEELQCTPDGRTINLPDTETPNSIIQATARNLAANRKQTAPDKLRTELAKALQLNPERPCPPYRVLRPKADNGIIDNRFGIEVEPHLVLTLHMLDTTTLFHLPQSTHAELYIPNQSAWDELKKRQLPKNGRLYGFDWRGIGESMPNGCDQWNPDFFALYQFDYHYDSLARLLGESMLGARVQDILDAIAVLKHTGTDNITLTADGIGMVPAILAAFLSPIPVKTALNSRCRTFLDSALAMTEQLPQSMAIFNILKLTDMDELQRLIENS